MQTMRIRPKTTFTTVYFLARGAGKFVTQLWTKCGFVPADVSLQARIAYHLANTEPSGSGC